MLAAILALAFAVAFVAFGGVHPESRIVVHLLLALALLVACFLPSSVLDQGGRVVTLAAAGGLLVVADCAGLLPLPSFVGRLAEPGWVDDRGAVAWGFASTDVEATIEDLSVLLLPVGAAVAIGTWGLSSWRRSQVEVVLGVGAGLLVALGVAHAASGTSSLFGVWAPLHQPARFFAPFVDPNHFGGALLLAFPTALAVASDPERDPPGRYPFGLLAFAIGAATLWAGSAGAIAVLGLQALVVGFRRGWIGVLTAIPLTLGLGAAAVWVADTLGSDPHRGTVGRLGIWSACLRLWGDHWLLGSGAGTFGTAIAPYRTDHQLVAWAHAHDDWLERLTDTGVVGALLVLAAVVVVRPRQERGAGRSWPLALGVAGVLVHALVDFPLQIPAIAMGCAALLAWRVVVFQDRVARPPLLVRAALVAWIVPEAFAAAWSTRDHFVDRAVRTLHTDGAAADERAAARSILGSLAPWRPEAVYEDALGRLRAGDPAGAATFALALASAHPGDADAQRSAALVLLAADRAADAVPAAQRAVVRGPSDWRNWSARAQVISVASPGDAASAWRDAIVAGVPGSLQQGWTVLPVGLYWVDALEDAPVRVQEDMARFVLKQRDRDAALVGFENVVLADPGEVHLGYADALVGTGRLAEARAYLEAVEVQHPDDLDVERHLADVLERQGDWEDATAVWTALMGRSVKDRARAVAAVEHLRGPTAALAVLDRDVLAGRPATSREILLRARLLGAAGRRDACVGEIASSGLLDEAKFKTDAARILAACGDAVHP